MNNQIENYCKSRGIKWLVHFTQTSNLESILQNGILPRSVLIERGINSSFNDLQRLDKKLNASCISITFPNYKMFWNLRCKQPQVKWVVLTMKPKILWEKRCAFYYRNAAHHSLCNIPVDNLCTLSALETMFFEDYTTTKNFRSTLKIPDNYTTDPQAEVLVLENIPPDLIYLISFCSQKEQEEWQQAHADCQTRCIVYPSDFLPRSDCARWKKEDW